MSVPDINSTELSTRNCWNAGNVSLLLVASSSQTLCRVVPRSINQWWIAVKMNHSKGYTILYLGSYSLRVFIFLSLLELKFTGCESIMSEHNQSETNIKYIRVLMYVEIIIVFPPVLIFSGSWICSLPHFAPHPPLAAVSISIFWGTLPAASMATSGNIYRWYVVAISTTVTWHDL